MRVMKLDGDLHLGGQSVSVVGPAPYGASIAAAGPRRPPINMDDEVRYEDLQDLRRRMAGRHRRRPDRRQQRGYMWVHYISGMSLLKMSAMIFHSPFTFCHTTRYFPLSSMRPSGPSKPRL